MRVSFRSQGRLDEQQVDRVLAVDDDGENIGRWRSLSTRAGSETRRGKIPDATKEESESSPGRVARREEGRGRTAERELVRRPYVTGDLT